MVPTPDERAEARRWSVAYVRRKGIFGRLVGATLAGEAVTSTAITASIPVLLELARRALRTAESEGAPADPRDADEE